MISALILAAGQSLRMGRPKMLLPWGQSTVLGRVIQVFRAASIDDILVVSGSSREDVEAIAETCNAGTVYNPEYTHDEMLGSLQAGLRVLGPGVQAALIGLGDQPQVQEQTVRRIVSEYVQTSEPLIVPSYQMHRGHPWLAARELWNAILQMQPPDSPREFLHLHAAEIHYVELDTVTILQDLDTPEDYLNTRP